VRERERRRHLEQEAIGETRESLAHAGHGDLLGLMLSWISAGKSAMATSPGFR
jgi:uncharacterized protein YidB (DUF937 family)